jgi:hypothetical protein
MQASRERRGVPLWALVSAAWIAPSILAAFQAWAQGRLGGSGATVAELLWEGGDWLLYAGLTPVVFWISRRLPLVRETLAGYAPLHLVASVLITAAWAGGGVLLSLVLFGTPPYGRSAVGWFFTSLPFGVPVYFAVVGVERAATFFEEAKDRQAQLAEARLAALRMQMQPHFLLNSLNAITVVVRDRDTTTATRMLEQLGDILRRVVRTDRPMEVPLAEELEFVRQYLAIEHARFVDRLRTEFDVPEALQGALVPEFILQPLVENAIRHGLARRLSATDLIITARRKGEVLILTVRDHGTEPGAGPVERGEGVGLANTRERLATLFGARASLTLETTAGEGTIATIRLPWRSEPAPWNTRDA